MATLVVGLYGLINEHPVILFGIISVRIPALHRKPMHSRWKYPYTELKLTNIPVFVGYESAPMHNRVHNVTWAL